MPSDGQASRLYRLRRRPALLVLLAAELVLLVLAFWNALRPLPSLTFTPDTLENWAVEAPLTTDDAGRTGIGEPGVAPEETLFATPALDLPAGYYRVTVTYRAEAWQDENGHIAVPSLTSYTEQPGTVCTYEGHLDPGAGQQTLDLCVLHRSTDARLMLRGNGAVFYLEGLSLTPNRALMLLLAVGTALLLLAADLLLVRLLPGSSFAVPVPARAAALGILGVVVLACLPLLQNNGAMGGHDLYFHLQRIQGIADSLADGEFPVRLYHNVKSGYGYAPPLYYGELLLYIPALLRLAGLDLRLCYQGYLWGVTLATALVCYRCLREIFGRRGLALLGTVLFVLSPYRLICIYVRAAVGEYTALLFLPLIALGLWRLYTGKGKAWVLLAVGFGGLLQTHIITLILTTLVVLCLALGLWRRTFRRPVLLEWFKAALSCILINLWFLVPFVTMAGGRLAGESGGLDVPGLTLAQLLTRGETAVFGLALPLGGAILLAVYLLFPPAPGPARTAGLCALAAGAFSLFASTDLFPWQTVVRLPLLGTLLGSIQFPWRFLGLAAIALTLASVWAVQGLQQAGQAVAARGTGAAVLALTLLFCLQFLPEYVPLESAGYVGDASQWMVLDNSNLVWPMDDLYLPDGAAADGLGYAAAEPADIQVDAITRNGRTTTVTCSTADTEGFVELPLLYYPGYRADTGTLYPSEHGLVGLAVPAGFDGTVTVRWQEPRRWLAADLISLVSFAALAGRAVYRRRKKA